MAVWLFLIVVAVPAAWALGEEVSGELHSLQLLCCTLSCICTWHYENAFR